MGDVQTIQPELGLQLDRARRLRMDFNALIAFEDASGKSLMAGEVDLSTMSLKDVRLLLWCCLVWEDPALTVEQVGAFFHMGNIRLVTEALRQLTSAALPEPEAPSANGASASPFAEAGAAGRG